MTQAEDRPGAAEDDAGAFAAARDALRARALDFVRRYHRLEVDLPDGALPGPVLFVANHGFGGIFDLNVLAVAAALEDLNLDRPVTVLTHQLAWTVGVGPLIERFGARPASHDSAQQAFAAGHHVLVFPGGDLDAFKTFADRNRVVFGGRTGFARLALAQGVPIVPIVTAGAGESLLVLADGERLARALRLDSLLRVKALPITLSVPWGLSVGAVGFLPYLPMPTKLQTRVLAPIVPGASDAGASASDAGASASDAGASASDAGAFAQDVLDAMQQALTEMTARRRPLLG